MEKEAYDVDPKEAYSSDGSPHDNNMAAIIDNKGIRTAEAADIYGDIQTAEDYGYVARGLKSRHIQFIALGGTIGTGLFVGIGRAFQQAGPLSVLLGYTFTGIGVWALMMSLGEMSTWLPLPGAIPQFAARYVDGAMGFAVGWNSWYSNAITLCAEISAASIVIQFWQGADHINVAAWISIIIVLVICLNIFAVAIYGEAEFCFAAIKIITIVGLLIFALCIDLRKDPSNPHHSRLGFTYWKNPGAMKQYISTSPNTGRFLGLFSTLVNAAFSYGGVESVAVAAGEAENPRHNIPKAVRRVFWRILFFYVLGSLAIGVLVPYNDPNLLNTSGTAAASPWVIAVNRAGIKALPSIINAVILTSASSSANAFLYIGARYLYSLAQNGQAPRFLLKCSKRGVPYWCVLCTASISGLTYLSTSSGSDTAFTWFQNLTTISTLFTWVSICVAYIRFHAALKAQGIDRNTLVFKGPFQPYLAWGALIYFTIIIVFNGFYAFTPWDAQSFVTAYVGIPIYFGLYLFWKLFKRTRAVNPSEADIFTGKAALDAADAHWPERVPRNFVERAWFWLA